MKQVLISLRAPLALLVICGVLLFSLRSHLEGLPGVIGALWLAYLCVFGGAVLNAIEDAHEREKGARG